MLNDSRREVHGGTGTGECGRRADPERLRNDVCLL